MAITGRGSVLILGAGVSADFGMPLGDQLVDLIVKKIGEESDAAKVASGRRSIDAGAVVNWAAHSREWTSHPIFGTALREKMSGGQSLSHEQANAAHSDLLRLRQLLTNQTAETIDSFIAENPQIGRTAKLAVAALMLRATYSLNNETGQLTVRPFSARTTHEFVSADRVDRNWMHLLINIIRHGIDTGEIASGQKIQVVTFNYDTILEHVLKKQFTNREKTLHEYDVYIDIHHVHGKFGAIADTCSDPARTAMEWASGIYVVNEHGVSEALTETRNDVRALLREAHDIYAMGFAFAGPNCRTLGLHTPHAGPQPRTLTYCNYDGNRGTKESAERYFGPADSFEKAGDPVRKLSAAAFIKAGYLGEPPS